MPIEIRCKSCGFLFGRVSSPASIHDVLRKWGYRCPVCMSSLDKLMQTLNRIAYGIRIDEEDMQTLSQIEWKIEIINRGQENETSEDSQNE